VRQLSTPEPVRLSPVSSTEEPPRKSREFDLYDARFRMADLSQRIV
jgi:hypothetical protein